VRSDDPLLTARPPGPRVPLRVIVTGYGRIPPDCQLLRTTAEAPLLIAAAVESVVRNGQAWQAAGAEVFTLPDLAGPANVRALLDELGRRRCTNILVEGGAGLLGSFLDARAIDEVHVYLAPRLAGGRTAASPIAGNGVAQMTEALTLTEWTVEPSGDDLYLHGRVRR
jgi:diaminohydroxyphosphoribosylaminopyrimidine deaminase/5-amino-6-(5-phosphoribosylamino)uracil reductase